MAVTLVHLGVYAAYLVLRYEARLARPPRRLPRARRLRARDRRPRSASSSPTSHEPHPRRPLAPVDARRGARARVRAARARPASSRATLAGAAARRSASRPATAPSSTSSATTPRRGRSRALAAVSGAGRGASCAASSTGSRDEAAALHLFRVAAGLDSMVPGEGEILGQVREAFEAGAPGPMLDRLFRAGAARREEGARRDGDRREPRLGLVRGGRARAAGLRRARRLPRAARRRRARRGAGRAQPRRARGGDRVRRQPLGGARRGARRALRRRGGPARAGRGTSSRDVDVLVSSTGAPGRTLGRAEVEAALRSRKGRPLFLIDLAVPRDLDPAIHELDGCFLYDIDDLESVVAAEPRRPPPRGRARGGDRRRGGRALPRVAGVARGRAGDRVAAGVGGGDPRRRARARASAGSGSRSDQHAAVESVTARIVDKLLHLPTVRLKEAAAGADGGSYAEAVRHLFGLDDDASADAPPRRLARQPARADAGRARGRPSARPGRRDRARPDHDRRRPRPAQPVRRDRRARRVRQGARGGAARRPDRRRRALGEGHDLDRHRRARRRRVPAARGPARRALRRRRAAARDADRHRLGAAAGAAARARAGAVDRAAARKHRHAAAQARRARASTPSCSPPAGSTGSASLPRSAFGSSPAKCSRRPGRARSRSRFAPARRSSSPAADDAETRRRVEAERVCVCRGRRRLPRAGRGPPRRHDADRRSSPTRTGAGSSAAPGDDPTRARRGARTAGGRTVVLTRPEGRNERLADPAPRARPRDVDVPADRSSSRSRPGRSTSTATTGSS